MEEWIKFIDDNFQEANDEMKALLLKYAEHHLLIEMDLPEPPEHTNLDKALIFLSTLDPSQVVIVPNPFYKSLQYGKVHTEVIVLTVDCYDLPDKDYGYGLIIANMRNKYKGKMLFVHHLFFEERYEDYELTACSRLIEKR